MLWALFVFVFANFYLFVPAKSLYSYSYLICCIRIFFLVFRLVPFALSLPYTYTLSIKFATCQPTLQLNLFFEQFFVHANGRRIMKWTRSSVESVGRSNTSTTSYLLLFCVSISAWKWPLQASRGTHSPGGENGGTARNLEDRERWDTGNIGTQRTSGHR